MTEHGELEHGASFEAFFDTERARLLGTLCLVTGDRGEARELMQETFVRVWERWDQVRAHADPSGYLYRNGVQRLSRPRSPLAPRHPSSGRAAANLA